MPIMPVYRSRDSLSLAELTIPISKHSSSINDCINDSISDWPYYVKEKDHFFDHIWETFSVSVYQEPKFLITWLLMFNIRSQVVKNFGSW